MAGIKNIVELAKKHPTITIVVAIGAASLIGYGMYNKFRHKNDAMKLAAKNAVLDQANYTPTDAGGGNNVDAGGAHWYNPLSWFDSKK